jgi:hypothetical protein
MVRVVPFTIGPIVPPAVGSVYWPPSSTSVAAGTARRQAATLATLPQPTFAANCAPTCCACA